MHIRPNIPTWGTGEVANGMMALLSGGRIVDFRDKLRTDLNSLAEGWEPILLSSARFGLSLAVQLLGLEGQRVAVPGYVCPAVLTGLRNGRAIPVAIDCEPSSMRFDLRAIKRAAESGEIKAVLSPNTYGLDQDYEELKKLGLPLIEDAAYQCGRDDPNTSSICGTRGDVGVWSFNFKALAGVGGGVLWVPPRYDITRLSLSQGLSRWNDAARFLNYTIRTVGRHRIPRFLPGASAPTEGSEPVLRNSLAEINESCMSHLQAAVALRQWYMREELTHLQRENAERLLGVIQETRAFSVIDKQRVNEIAHLLPLRVMVKDKDTRAAVHLARSVLHVRGIQTEPPYPILIGTASELPNTYKLAASIFLVPCNPSLNLEQIELICSALKEASRQVERRFQTVSR